MNGTSTTPPPAKLKLGAAGLALAALCAPVAPLIAGLVPRALAEGLPAAACEASDIDKAIASIDRAASVYQIVAAEWWHLVQERELAAAVRKLADVRSALDVTEEAAARGVALIHAHRERCAADRATAVVAAVSADVPRLRALWQHVADRLNRAAGP